MPRVVCFPRARGTILLGRHGDAAKAHPGRWSAVSSGVEDDPETAARRAIEDCEAVTAGPLVRAGDPIEATADRPRIYPYLFDCEPRKSHEPTADWVFETVEWVHPTEIRRRETVPGLWRSYAAVAPTVETVREDDTHGSAYVSVRALEVLRDRAAVEDWAALAALAEELLGARPSMAALENRVNRAMFGAETPAATAVERAARAGIERAVAADDRAARRAAAAIDGVVLTLSRSGTVEDALLAAEPEAVVVLESRPDREGVGVAERLADAGLDATVTLDAAVAHTMADVDTVLVGADTVLADGSVVNKVGTRTAALAAAREGVPVYAVAAADKISPGTEPTLEPIGAIYGGDAVEIDAPLFDRTPADLVTGVLTEEGPFDAEDVADRAADRERWAGWSKDPTSGAG